MLHFRALALLRPIHNTGRTGETVIINKDIAPVTACVTEHCDGVRGISTRVLQRSTTWTWIAELETNLREVSQARL